MLDSIDPHIQIANVELCWYKCLSEAVSPSAVRMGMRKTADLGNERRKHHHQTAVHIISVRVTIWLHADRLMRAWVTI